MKDEMKTMLPVLQLPNYQSRAAGTNLQSLISNLYFFLVSCRPRGSTSSTLACGRGMT